MFSNVHSMTAAMFAQTERLSALDPATRAIVIEVLDELSRPLGRREIEKTLARRGYTRRERMDLVPAMMHFDLIAIVPKVE